MPYYPFLDVHSTGSAVESTESDLGVFSVKFRIKGDFAAVNSDLESARRQVKAWLAEKMSVHINRLSDLQLTSGTTHK